MTRFCIQVYLDKDTYDEFVRIAEERGQKKSTFGAHVIGQNYQKYAENTKNTVSSTNN